MNPPRSKRFVRPDASQRLEAFGLSLNAATTTAASKRFKLGHSGTEVPLAYQENELDFPQPLVLKGDDLDLDPECPGHTFAEWLEDEDRQIVTKDRRTIYVVPVSWATTEAERGELLLQQEQKVNVFPAPSLKDMAEYVEAFYHGMKVKMLPNLQFMKWEEEEEEGGRKRRKQQKQKHGDEVHYVGLKTNTDVLIRVRVRQSPDIATSHQINMLDCLDALSEELPDDAYCIVGLTQYDTYENDEDLYTCGRAFGGSRISLVSIYRYNPVFDQDNGVKVLKSWPLSKCGSTSFYAKEVRDGVQCINEPKTPQELTGLWLSRVCKPLVHELGHCLGLDHCVYYACTMQGTSGMTEDNRQPPYLCPIDLRKVVEGIEGCDVVARYQMILKYCECPTRANIHMFAGYAAWIRHRLKTVDP